jgi:P27 family predicted phage terminase small subunit
MENIFWNNLKWLGEIMRGRKPTPTKLKVLAGNPGKRPLNDKEPKPTLPLPSPPAVLKGAALAEWKRVCGELESLGLLTGLDVAVLAGYCVACSMWDDAVGKIEKMGTMIRTTNGNIIQNPAVGIANRQYELILKASSVLGLDPSTRSRMKIEKTGEEKASKWASL